MSVEDELHYLLEELAEDHVVGSPPNLGSRPIESLEHSRGRSARFALAAVAACAVVLVGGLVVIGSRSDDQAPATDPSGVPETTQAPPPESSMTTSEVTGGPSLDLIRIDALSSPEGTIGVEIVFDGDIPMGDAVPVENVASPPSDRVGYATQTSLSTPVSVCENTHSFPSPGNRIVDIFVPGDWFDPAASIDPQVVGDPDGELPAKIIVCEPLNGAVQISVWGSASGRMDDVRVSLDERTIIVDIAPDPAAAPAMEVENETELVPSTDPFARPLVAITDEGDAVYLAGEEESIPVLILDGPGPDATVDGAADTVDRVAFGAAENRFIVSRCCLPGAEIVSARPDALPIPVEASPPVDQLGEAQLVFDGFGYAPALHPSGDRLVSIVGDGKGIFVLDAAADTFANVRLPGEAGDLRDLLWNDTGIFVLGRAETTWTLTTATYGEGRIELNTTRNFAILSSFEDLQFAGTAVDDEIAVHDRGTDMVLSGTVDDYGNLHGEGRGSSLQVLDLPGPALSAWFQDPGQLIWVDTLRTLRVDDQVIPGRYTWARR